MYRKHQDLLNGSTPPEIPAISPPVFNASMTGDDVDYDNDEGDDVCCIDSSLQERQKKAALFALKTRHVHKVAQSSIQGVMCDFTTKLESTVLELKSRVLKVIENTELKIKVAEIFDTPNVLDPFGGLENEYQLKKYYHEKFLLVVSVNFFFYFN